MNNAVKILIVVTSQAQMGETGRPTGYYLSEVTHPYYRLAARGFAVDFASPKGGKAPMDEASRDLSDPDNKRFLEDPSLVKKLDNTLKTGDADPKDYAAVIFAGGHGTMWDFPQDPGVQRLAAGVYEKGGVVAAVCHGPAALVNVRLSDGRYLIAGREVAAFTNEEEEAVGLAKTVPFALETALIGRGASFKKAANFAANVAATGRLVTGQNPASAAGVGQAVADLLKAGAMAGSEPR